MRPSAVEDCYHEGLNSSPYTHHSHGPDASHSQEVCHSFYASGLTHKASPLQLGAVIRTSKMLYRVQSYLKTAGYKELHMNALKL